MTYWARLVHPEYGYPSEQKRAKELNPYIFYKVEDVNVGGSISYFKIVGEKKWFNTVQFEFYNNDMKPINILKTEFNNYEARYLR